MIQIVIVLSLFAIAATFLGIKLYKSFFGSKHDCDGCAVSEMVNHKNH